MPSARTAPTPPLLGARAPRTEVAITRVARAQPPDPTMLDDNGVLATEHDAAMRIAGWRATADYAVPPLLAPSNREAEAERGRLAEEAVRAVQRLQRIVAGRGAPDRGFQRKTLYATTTARFRVPANLPSPLACGPFQPGADWRAIVRFSSAAATLDADPVPDQRAVGVRVTDNSGRAQDLTFTSGAAGNHARDARQFISTMQAVADGAGGGMGGRLRALVGLLRREGLRETLRLARARRGAVDTGVSLSALSYFSRSPIEMGDKLVHLVLLPVRDPPPGLLDDARDARNGLGRDLAMRRAFGELRFRLAAAEAPTLEDLSTPPTGPWITVAELLLPQQAASEAVMLRVAARVHARTAMHPFNRWDETSLRPRGELNEILRRPVYRASSDASGRHDDPPSTPQLDA